MIQWCIEELQLEELEEAVQVIDATFRLFEAPDYSDEGIENFFRFANGEALRENLRGDMQMYVAKAEGKIVGVLGCRNYSHINLLFVLQEFQRTELPKHCVAKQWNSANG